MVIDINSPSNLRCQKTHAGILRIRSQDGTLNMNTQNNCRDTNLPEMAPIRILASSHSAQYLAIPKLPLSAMARVKMIHAAASVRNQPHSPTDNENTPFNSIRLLRGAPPGRVRCSNIVEEIEKPLQRENFAAGTRATLLQRARHHQEAHGRLSQQEEAAPLQLTGMED